MKSLKKWFYSWAAIDLLAFGLGTIGIISYVVFRNSYPNTESHWFDIWTNLATEILGVWLSVRIIDSIIKRNSKNKQVRNNYINQLGIIRRQIQHSYPSVNEWDIGNIINELKWLKENYKKENNRFHESEQIKNTNLIVILEKIVDSFENHIKLREDQERFFIEIDEQEVLFNKRKKKIVKEIEDITSTPSKNTSDKIKEIISNNFDILENYDLENIEKYLKNLDKYLNSKTPHIPHSPNMYDRFYFSRRKIIEVNPSIEIEFKKLLRDSRYDPQKIISLTSSENVEEKNINVNLFKYHMKYVSIIEKFALNRIQREKLTSSFEQIVEKIIEDINEETF